MPTQDKTLVCLLSNCTVKELTFSECIARKNDCDESIVNLPSTLSFLPEFITVVVGAGGSPGGGQYGAGHDQLQPAGAQGGDRDLERDAARGEFSPAPQHNAAQLFQIV